MGGGALREKWSTEIYSTAFPPDQQVPELRFLVIQRDFWFTQ